jgi:formaldehyde-activating enzyme involved in methanogenesis
LAIARALKGEPKADYVIQRAAATTHPFRGF